MYSLGKKNTVNAVCNGPYCISVISAVMNRVVIAFTDLQKAFENELEILRLTFVISLLNMVH